MTYKLYTFLQGFVNAVIGLVEVFLSLRFILRLFGASAHTPFVVFIYNATTPLLDPFRGIFPTQTIERGYNLEFSTLFAIIIYALIGYLIVALIQWLENLSEPPPTDRNL